MLNANKALVYQGWYWRDVIVILEQKERRDEFGCLKGIEDEREGKEDCEKGELTQGNWKRDII